MFLGNECEHDIFTAGMWNISGNFVEQQYDGICLFPGAGRDGVSFDLREIRQMAVEAWYLVHCSQK